jgi:hypothetical protein
MSKGWFMAQDLGEIFNEPTNGGCTCAMCHNQVDADLNGGHFLLDADPDLTFAAAQQLPGILNFVKYDAALGQVVESRGIELKGIDHESCSCQVALDLKVNGVINVDDPAYCHPSYELYQSTLDRIEDLVSNAISRSTVMICTPNNTP